MWQNLAFKEGHLSDTQKMGYITLLCKDSDNSTDVKNYRPISLLNCDYKLISKTITNRVKKVLEYIINPDQTCAVPGRTIFNNLHLMRNIIDYCEQKQLLLAFISLDQEKAFDRANYDFLFQTLSAFNFGPSLIHWIKTLYTEVRSSIIVNNHISDSFLLHRGVRQVVVCFDFRTVRHKNSRRHTNYQALQKWLINLCMQTIAWLFAFVMSLYGVYFTGAGCMEARLGQNLILRKLKVFGWANGNLAQIILLEYPVSKTVHY